MSLDKATVDRIATLARIAVPDSEKEALATELSQILDWVEQLSEVDTDAVEPLYSVNRLRLWARADQVKEGNQTDAIVMNAPESFENFFVVPKVVE